MWLCFAAKSNKTANIIRWVIYVLLSSFLPQYLVLLNTRPLYQISLNVVREQSEKKSNTNGQGG